jgi:hypothetical protein
MHFFLPTLLLLALGCVAVSPQHAAAHDPADFGASLIERHREARIKDCDFDGGTAHTIMAIRQMGKSRAAIIEIIREEATDNSLTFERMKSIVSAAYDIPRVTSSEDIETVALLFGRLRRMKCLYDSLANFFETP